MWAFGCIVYELCTLKVAFPGRIDEIAQVYGKIKKVRYDPIPADLPYSDRVRRLIELLI